MIYSRCTAPSTDIDGGRFIQHSAAHTNLLSETCELKQLWDDHGIVGDVKVTIISHVEPVPYPDYTLSSHLQYTFHVQIFMIYWHQIFCIN